MEDSLERRSLLLSLAASGSLLALSSTADAQDSSERVVMKRSVAPTSLKDAQAPTKSQASQFWEDLKSRAKAAYPALSVFDNSFEQGSVPALNKITNDEDLKLTHNPRLIEPLLGDIASLLDRCVAYRREGRELEIAGVAAGASNIATLTLQSSEKDLAEINVSADAARKLVEEYPEAVAAFGQNPAGKQLKAELSANQIIDQRSDERKSLILSRLKFSQDLELQLLSRHDVQGNAHNYSERFEDVRRLFESDILSAYRRAIAVSKGFESVFGISPPKLPEVTAVGFLDRLVIWTRTQ